MGNQWNNNSDKQHIALKAVFVLLALGLQKPGQKSKAKDMHKECLKKRLALWKDGKINKLLHEGRMIQTRIGKGKKSNPPNRAKIFVNLFGGPNKFNDALFKRRCLWRRFILNR